MLSEFCSIILTSSLIFILTPDLDAASENATVDFTGSAWALSG